jgi:ABC-2 type transport system ATP-binding protein
MTAPTRNIPAAPGIQARALTKRYGHTTVVDDLSFTARPGAITGFLGPNGSGKSTTLRMLLGLTTPSSGAITIGGRRLVELDNPARTVGALIDARSIHPHRSAKNHLLSYTFACGVDPSRVGEVLDLVGLAGTGNRRAGQFSLGMQQRLGIATALLGDPEVLVFDEPLNGLDPEGIRWLRTFMRDLAEEGRTVLFSSHLMSEMELTADDLVVIDHGRLIAESSLQEFVRTHTTPFVRVRTRATTRLAYALGRAGIAAAAEPDATLILTGADSTAVGQVAAEAGIALEELATVRESLEDVFLRLTAEADHHLDDDGQDRHEDEVPS